MSDMLQRFGRAVAAADVDGFDDEGWANKAQWLNKNWPRYAKTYAPALLAALDPPREEIYALSEASSVSFELVCSVLMALRQRAQGGHVD